jgi:hypothetical protein
MTIFIEAQQLSNLTNYVGLVTSVQRWLNRTDLQDDVPDFIRLAEARFRDVLVMPDQEVAVTLTPAASVPLPIDFDSIRSLGIPGYAPMDQVSPANFTALPVNPDNTPITGQPTRVMIAAGAMQFWPMPDKAYAANMVYRANLPALGPSVDSNWLLARRPDIYLYGTILQAEAYGWNDERVPLIKAALDEALGEAMQAGTRKRYGSGPLSMKPPTSERIGLLR